MNGPKRQAPLEAKDILPGARQAFAELGYHDARVEDVLRAANVSRPTFYKFFGSKDEIFERLVDDHLSVLLASILGVFRTTPVDHVGWIGECIDRYLRWRIELGPFARVLDRELRRPGSYVERKVEPVFDALARAWQNGLSRAGLEPRDPLFFDAFIGAAMMLAENMPDEAEAEDLARRRHVLLTVVRGALEAGP